MLNSIKLINFRQHRDLTVNMTAGLNVIRGENEAGKSTINEAIGYAFYGARFLAEPLDSVVTWGEKATTLKVQVTFTYDGIEGVVVRGKSGAEAKYGDAFVTGNAAVTEFFEKLFRASAAMAASLQIVEQKKVLGALEKGSSEAVSLIEGLADFSLLESIIDSIQRERPCGNPALTVDRINTLEETLSNTVIAEADPTAVQVAEAKLAELDAQVAESERKLSSFEGEYEKANNLVSNAESLAGAVAMAKRQVAELDAQLAEPPFTTDWTQEAVDSLKAELTDAEAALRRWRAYSTEVKLNVVLFQGSRQQFLEHKAAIDDLYIKKSDAASALQRELITLKATKINEKACAFCRKDLSAVPEVAEVNAAVDSKVAAKQLLLEGLLVELEELRQKKVAASDLRDAEAAVLAAYDKAYWTLSDSTYPPSPLWIGAVPQQPSSPANLAASIRQGEEALRKLAQDSGRRQVLADQRAQLLAPAAQVVPDTTEARAFIAQCHAAVASHSALLEQRRVARGELQMAQTTFKAAQDVADMRRQMKADAEKQLADKRAELQQMQFYNGLIDKVRKARPAVANKLWSLVLSAVSHYTTIGRGEASTVTRDSEGFKINGKPLSSYSGSAKDVLGLAVRLALVKTFLPSCPFLLLDEVAAACSDQRELQMLGMVTAAEIPQTLLVTHSPMAESYAANLIEI